MATGQSSSNVTVVLGGQWGDEGKGKLVDLLASKADYVCRCQVFNKLALFLNSSYLLQLMVLISKILSPCLVFYNIMKSDSYIFTVGR